MKYVKFACVWGPCVCSHICAAGFIPICINERNCFLLGHPCYLLGNRIYVHLFPGFHVRVTDTHCSAQFYVWVVRIWTQVKYWAISPTPGNLLLKKRWKIKPWFPGSFPCWNYLFLVIMIQYSCLIPICWRKTHI